MSFDAHEMRIRQIFSGDSKFVIPRNQRDYVWSEKNWRELADDIKYIFEMKEQEQDISHFIGSFVFQQLTDEYIIIDGQQRLSTFMIMLSAICVIQNEMNERDEFGLTKQYLIGNIGLKSEYIRLRNDALSNLEMIIGYSVEYKDNLSAKLLLKNVSIDKKKKPNKLIFECFEFFYNRFLELSENKIERLSQIRSIIVDMKVIHIISVDELDCYDVFEILNARGVSLKDSELLKNYIFKYVRPKYSVDTAKNIWNKICNNMNLCDDNMEQFLLHYFTARIGKSSSKINTFQLAKENIPKDKMIDLLIELNICSELYIFFYKPESYKNEIVAEVLSFFKLENQRQFRPIFLAYLLAYHKNKISEKELELSFLKIKNFYFAFGLVCKNPSNIIEKSVYKVANNIYNTNENINHTYFTEVFEKYYPARDTFISSFSEKGYSNKNKRYGNSKNKKEIYYILSEMEKYYQSESGSELMCDISKCNIEHINSDSDVEDMPCKMGNLLLLSTTINHNIGNISFREKRNGIKNLH